VTAILKPYIESTIPYFQNIKFVSLSSLVGRYFYNMSFLCIVKSLKLCFPLMSRTIIHAHVNIIIDFPITYRNASVLCQSECPCLHKTINIVALFVKK